MMNFNGVDLSAYLTVNRVTGRSLADYDITSIKVGGRDGERFASKRRPPRVLTVNYTIISEDEEELRTIIDELNAILNVDEPVPIVFDDEPTMTYYGVPEDTSESGEFVRWNQGSISFYCADPYKYGPEKVATLSSDITSVHNAGSAEAFPVFELEVTKPITFASIMRGEPEDSTYNLIGIPADDDVEVIDTRTSVLYENGSTIDTWTHTTDMRMVSHDVNIDGLNGVMGTDGAGIRVESRGPTTQKQNGPAVFKELPNAIQDFEVVSTFDIISRREIENWRMVIYFLDENLNNIGHMGIKDNSRNYKRRTALSQLGQHQQGVTLIGDNSYVENNARDTTLFYLRFRREGKRFKVYIAHWRNQKHETVWEASYNDVNNEFQGKLKYITLFIGRFQDRVNPNRARINSVEVFELSQAIVAATPYLGSTGDIPTFHQALDKYLINGESRSDLRDFGGSFFTLKRGTNLLTVTPEDSFNAEIRYRERYV